MEIGENLDIRVGFAQGLTELGQFVKCWTTHTPFNAAPPHLLQMKQTQPKSNTIGNSWGEIFMKLKVREGSSGWHLVTYVKRPFLPLSVFLAVNRFILKWNILETFLQYKYIDKYIK